MTRPIRRYAIDRSACYSLRDAARAADLPTRRLRRAVVLGDLPAEPVADERDYLIQGRDLQEHLRSIRRGERVVFSESESINWGIGVFLAFPLIAILTAAAGFCTTPPPLEVPDAQALHEGVPVRVPRPLNTGRGPWSWYPEIQNRR